MEIVVEPWIDGLWDSLKNVLSHTTNTDSADDGEMPSSLHDLTSTGTDTGQTMAQRVATGSADTEVCGGETGSTSSLQKVPNVPASTSTAEQRVTGDSVKRTSTKERVVGGLAESVKDKLSISSSPTKTRSTELPNTDVTQVSESSPLATETQASSGKTETTTAGSSLKMTASLSSSDGGSFKEDAPCRTQSTKLSNDETMQVSPQATETSTQSGETKIASSLEVAAVSSSSSSGSNGGSKRRGSFKEDASWREELRTPSMELASAPLTLPTIPPLFVKVLMKTVSSCTSTCIHTLEVGLCLIDGTFTPEMISLTILLHVLPATANVQI